MKFFPVIFLMFLFAACGDSKKPTVTAPAHKTPKQPPLSTKPGKIYEGVWMKSDYLDAVAQTRSIVKSVDKVTGITAMRIDLAELKGDSVIVPVGWDNHNGGAVTLNFEPGKHPNALKFGDGELGYRIINSDTLLTFYWTYNGQAFEAEYRKVQPLRPGETLMDGVNKALNRAVIAGSYKAGNSSVKVTFGVDGTVTGLPGLSKYLIEPDMKYGPLNNLDQITFNLYSDGQVTYHYAIRGNLLELYEIKPDAAKTKFIKGNLKYRLQRII